MAPRNGNGDLLRLCRCARAQSANNLPDADLLACWQGKGEGHRFALEELVRRHQDTVFRTCYRLLGNEADARDACQATFLCLLKHQGKVEHFAGWLCSVAMNKARRLRKQAGRLSALTRRKAIVTNGPTEQPCQAESDEQVAIIQEEIAGLPDKDREGIVLVVLEEIPYQEAAQALGVPVGTLKARVSRARRKLQERLTSRGVSLSAGLVVALSRVPLPQAPPGLIEATVEAAVTGAVSARVELLLAGGLQVPPLRVTLGALLLLSLLGTAWALQSGRPQASPSPEPPLRPPGRAAPGQAEPQLALRKEFQVPQPGPGDVIHNADCVAFADDRFEAVTLYSFGIVRRWHLETGREVCRFKGPQPPAYAKSVAVHPRAGIAVGAVGVVHLHDFGGALLHRFGGLHAATYQVLFTAGGDRLVCLGGDGVWTFDVPSRKQSSHHASTFGLVAGGCLCPGDRLVCNEFRQQTGGLPILLNRTSGSLVRQFREALGASCVAASPDGRHLLTAGASGVAISADGRYLPAARPLPTGHPGWALRLWDLNTGKEVARLHGHQRRVRSVAFVPGGRFVVSGGDDGSLRLWDLRAKKQVAMDAPVSTTRSWLAGTNCPVTSVAVSATGQFALSGSLDGTVRLYQLWR
jgi:RNA polymerase sigma factor (sigma-70 family)